MTVVNSDDRIDELEETVALLVQHVVELRTWQRSVFEGPKDAPIHHAANINVPTIDPPPLEYKEIRGENIFTQKMDPGTQVHRGKHLHFPE